MQLLEVSAKRRDIIERVGSFRVTGYLHPLPRCEVGVDLALGGIDLGLNRCQLSGHIDIVFERLLMQGFELLFEFAQGLFEFQQIDGSIHTPTLKARVGDCQRGSANSGYVIFGKLLITMPTLLAGGCFIPAEGLLLSGSNGLGRTPACRETRRMAS